MVDLWRDFWIRETRMGQQVALLHERYMMMMMMMKFNSQTCTRKSQLKHWGAHHAEHKVDIILNTFSCAGTGIKRQSNTTYLLAITLFLQNTISHLQAAKTNACMEKLCKIHKISKKMDWDLNLTSMLFQRNFHCLVVIYSCNQSDFYSKLIV